MWTDIFHYLLIGIGIYGVISLIADRVEERIKGELDEINSKLDELVEKNFHFDSSDDGW